MSNKNIAKNISSRCDATTSIRHNPILNMGTLNMTICRISPLTARSGSAKQTPERQHRTRFADEPDYNCQRDEDGRREEPHYYEAPRRDERQHDMEHRDGYDSREKPQPARASKASDSARRTESDSDGQAPTLPTGKGRHMRNLRNDMQTEEWEREADERYEAKDAADRAERQAKRHTDQEPSYHSRSEN